MNNQNMQGQYAGCASRLVAWLIDRAIIAAVVFVSIRLGDYITGLFGISLNSCVMANDPTALRSIICWGTTLFLIGFGLLFGPIYLIFFWVLAGQTPGKALVGLRIVRANAEPMNLRISIRRYFGYLLSFIALGLGFVAILFNDRRQAWHDRIAKTYVVYAWSARQNQPLIERLTNKVFRHRDRLTEQVVSAKTTIKEHVPEVGKSSHNGGTEGDAPSDSVVD